MLALCFLLSIGMTLIAESFGAHVGESQSYDSRHVQGYDPRYEKKLLLGEMFVFRGAGARDESARTALPTSRPGAQATPSSVSPASERSAKARRSWPSSLLRMARTMHPVPASGGVPATALLPG